MLAVFALLLVACRPTGDSTPPSEPQAAPDGSGSLSSAFDPQASPATRDPATSEPATAPATKDPKRALEQTAYMALDKSRCSETPMTKSGLYTPVIIRAEILTAGGLAQNIRVESTPARKSMADCYLAALKPVRFERNDGGDTIELELSLPRVGALDKDIIRRVVRSHIVEVRACYNKGLARDKTLKGRVMITFTIGADGAVSAAEVAESTFKDAEVARCVAAAVKTWEFPEPEGGGNVVVSYPFVLLPG